MSMNASALGAAIKEKLTQKLGDAPSTRDVFDKLGAAIAEAVVDHLTSSAEVLPTGTPPLAAGSNAVTGKGKLV